MHPISDKELDKLFQQGFEEAEFQPSNDVWGKIAVKMDQNEKAKNSFPTFWMAAASVAVIVGVSFWFYRPVDVIMLQGSTKEVIQNKSQEALTDLGTGEPVMDHVHADIKGFDFSKLAVEERTLNTSEEVTLPEKPDDEVPKEEILASNTLLRKNNQDAPVVRKDLSVPRYAGDQSNLDVTQADMIANAEVSNDDLMPDMEQVSPKKIRTVGSLVNFVISKVDRREDKIIEFKDGDEGSEVSGINLGLIKLKSRIK